MRKVIFILAVAALAVSLFLNIHLWFGLGRNDRQPRSGDTQWATKALEVRATREHAPIEVIEQLNDTAVVHFKEQVCVGLAPAGGVAGGRSVICFDRSSGRVTRDESLAE